MLRKALAVLGGVALISLLVVTPALAHQLYAADFTCSSVTAHFQNFNANDDPYGVTVTATTYTGQNSVTTGVESGSFDVTVPYDQAITVDGQTVNVTATWQAGSGSITSDPINGCSTPASATASADCNGPDDNTPGEITVTFSGGDGSPVTVTLPDGTVTQSPGDFPVTYWTYPNGSNEVIVSQNGQTVLDTTLSIQCGGSETPPPPPPCEQTEAGCPTVPPTTPPPVPPSQNVFIFSTCDGTFVRAEGSGILNVTVNGVLTQITVTSNPQDIPLTVVNGDVITASFQGGDTQTLTVNLNCSTATPTPSPTPSQGPSGGPTWTPTWTPKPPAPSHLPTVTGVPSSGNLAFTGGIPTWALWAFGWFLLAGLTALFLGRAFSLKREEEEGMDKN